MAAAGRPIATLLFLLGSGFTLDPATRAWSGSISVYRAWEQRLLTGSSLLSSSTASTRSWCSGLWSEAPLSSPFPDTSKPTKALRRLLYVFEA
jgi:hypothetical protein